MRIHPETSGEHGLVLAEFTLTRTHADNVILCFEPHFGAIIDGHLYLGLTSLSARTMNLWRPRVLIS